jgi:hypothetical protein
LIASAGFAVLRRLGLYHEMVAAMLSQVDSEDVKHEFNRDLVKFTVHTFSNYGSWAWGDLAKLYKHHLSSGSGSGSGIEEDAQHYPYHNHPLDAAYCNDDGVARMLEESCGLTLADPDRTFLDAVCFSFLILPEERNFFGDMVGAVFRLARRYPVAAGKIIVQALESLCDDVKREEIVDRLQWKANGRANLMKVDKDGFFDLDRASDIVSHFHMGADDMPVDTASKMVLHLFKARAEPAILRWLIDVFELKGSRRLAILGTEEHPYHNLASCLSSTCFEQWAVEASVRECGLAQPDSPIAHLLVDGATPSTAEEGIIIGALHGDNGSANAKLFRELLGLNK